MFDHGRSNSRARMSRQNATTLEVYEHTLKTHPHGTFPEHMGAILDPLVAVFAHTVRSLDVLQIILGPESPSGNMSIYLLFLCTQFVEKRFQNAFLKLTTLY